MKNAFFAVAALALALSPLAQAQSSGHNHASHGSHAAPISNAEVAQGSGVLHKIDAAKGIVNLTHEPIPALKWPAMTMDLKVRDTKLLEGFKPGQAVKFGLTKEPTEYVITSLSLIAK